jgi:hypothetical protein
MQVRVRVVPAGTKVVAGAPIATGQFDRRK